jgi:calcium/calmodulin-dependent protein kinase I
LLCRFSDVYNVQKVLGVGSYGVVAEVTEISTCRKLAIKICEYDKDKPSPSALALEREYKILTQLSHRNIIHVYQNEQKFSNYYIMELEMGAETLDQLAQRRFLSEDDCAKIMEGIFSALVYLHDVANIIHRDLKPENIVFSTFDDLGSLKVIDFGLATEYTKTKILDFAHCGTLLYTPPE